MPNCQASVTDPRECDHDFPSPPPRYTCIDSFTAYNISAALQVSLLTVQRREPNTSPCTVQTDVKFPSTTASVVTISITQITIPSRHIYDAAFVHTTKIIA